MMRTAAPRAPPVPRTLAVVPAAALATEASVWQHVEMAPPDPILGVSDAYKKSTSDSKLNLGVGAYRTEELKPFVLPVVSTAESRILDRQTKGNLDKEYLGIDGLPAFKAATAKLLLGDKSAAIADGRVATLQSLSGTGSLRIGAAFMNKYMPGAAVYLPTPTWGNHVNIFADAGVEVKRYRYFEAETRGLAYDAMMEDLAAAPSGSVVVLHGCAHNPTGVDPSMEQWGAIADLCIEKGLVPFFDVAYQGFASGDLDQDAASVRLFADVRGMECLVSQSYSKNLGLYSERVGALNAITSDKAAAGAVLSQMKRIARAMYSNPPRHGAQIVAEVVDDDALFDDWRGEMRVMSGRINTVRAELRAALEKRNPDKSWSFITSQIGMFSYTGMTEAQCKVLTDKYSVFLTKDGRISMAGLNSASVDHLANAIDDATRNA